VVVPPVLLVLSRRLKSRVTIQAEYSHSIATSTKHRERVFDSRALERCVDVILDDLRSIRVGAPAEVACDTIFRLGVVVAHGSFRTTARLFQQPGQILSNQTAQSRVSVQVIHCGTIIKLLFRDNDLVTRWLQEALIET